MDTYPYRAYIENLFSYGSDVKSNQMKAGEFWYPDAAGKFEDHDSATVKARNVTVAKTSGTSGTFAFRFGYARKIPAQRNRNQNSTQSCFS